MAGSTDRSTGNNERASSLVIRRFGDAYHFELELPSGGGGVRSTVWSGTRNIDPEVWSLLGGALEGATTSLRQPEFPTTVGTAATMIVPTAVGQLEQLGKLIFRYVLPEEVQEELARYSGSLLLATNDASLPWELIHDGIGFLGLRHAVGRRLVVSRRRRRDDTSQPASGALLIGGPSNDPIDAERELEMISGLLSSRGGCTVLRGPQATRSAVTQALMSGAFNVIHYVGQLYFDPAEGLEAGLLLDDRQVLTAADLERVVQGEPFVFINAGSASADQLEYVGPRIAELASTLAGAGARGFVGPAWPVYGSGSRVLAAEFYRQLADGTPAGEALRLARHMVRARLGDALTWSSYVFYGDPGQVVFRGPRAAALVLRPQAPFGPFVLEEEIGRGGMGVVWKAHQPALDRYVALKFLLNVHSEDERSRERFRREARIVARLRHPNLLLVHDFGEEEGYLFLVTEYLAGGTLQELIRREGRLSVERTVKLLGPIGDALDHLHTNGVVHRDVKPSNILLDSNGVPTLADCGVARLAEDGGRMTRTGAVIGTPAYMSPEQAGGRETEGTSDQYSLGVMLYEALVGRVPFESTTSIAVALAHLQEAPPSPRSLNPQLSPQVEATLLKALAKSPHDRFPTCRALVEALAGAGDAGGTATGPLPMAFAPTAVDGNGAAAPWPAAPTTPSGQYPTARGTGPRTFGAAPNSTAEVAPPNGPATATAVAAPQRSVLPTVILLIVAILGVGFALYQLGVLNLGSVQSDRPGAATPTVVAAEKPAVAEKPAPAEKPAVVPPAAQGPTAAPATAVPTAISPTSTAVPPPTVAPPPAEADWNSVLARLDGGLWANDMPRAADLLESYVAKYELQDPPQLSTAKEKLYAASVELGNRAVAANDFTEAKRRYARALAMRPNDPLAAGEARKVDLWLAGDEAYRSQEWEGAVKAFSELISIDANFGNASEKLTAAQVELAKTWTPTPAPAPVQPAVQQPSQGGGAAPSRPAPAPAPAPAPPPPPAPPPSGGSGGGGGAPPPRPLKP